MGNLVSYKIKADIDDHIFIMVEREGKPTISLDITNTHGITCLHARVEGNSIASIRCDVEPLPFKVGENWRVRYCSTCGEEINPVLSSGHTCKDSV